MEQLSNSNKEVRIFIYSTRLIHAGLVPPPPPATLKTFTVGVTDYTFNPINAIFGRILHTPDGHIVTQAFWQQKESISHDEIPYYKWFV